MLNKLIRLTVLGLVVGLAHSSMAGCGSCGSCADDGAKKKKDTNNVTPSDKK